ncbi:Two component regulator propeller [Chitinophaga costaii]|uniref:Two component regulator propeller n=1 Tax=Chitinophaga costaii TaxID=1335309 RepID=A0A1C4FN60_9BACT|nr:sensor histidine kinase [Chitinophaga costaii]PUZ29940.1 hypothetical protein DCM91_00190 [Chitinophaga costaii]SCC57103.1 Two component regulator propeller [Chitinophaga costaii]
MRYLLSLFLVVGCGWTSLQLYAQQTRATPATGSYIFRNIDQDNGLNSNEVMAINQDQRGYLWIGSAKGLQRYDGIRFLSCLREGNQEGDIAVNMIFKGSPEKLLYTQSHFDLYQWDFLKRTGSPVPLSGKVDDYTDGAGNRWKLQYYREHLYRLQKNEKGPWEVATFYFDGKDSWMVAPGFGLFLVDTVNHRLYTPENNPLHHPVLAGMHEPGSMIRNMVVDRHGGIWFISWAHLFYRYNIATRTLNTYSISDILHIQGVQNTVPAWVADVMEDSRGVIWLATATAGLLKYDIGTNQFEYITTIPGNETSLQYNLQINTIFQDRDENIWLGTDKGISVFNPYDNNFTVVHNAKTDTLIKNGAQITTVIETNKSDIWVGSWGGGITRYDSTFHVSGHVFFKGKYNENLIWSLLQQPGGDVWAGCQTGILQQIDPVTLQVQTSQPAALGHSTIRCMVHEPGGNTLLGLQSGRIVVWDTASRQFLPPVDNDIKRSSVVSMYVDKDICWATTREGLRAFDIRKRSFTATYKPAANYSIYFTGVDNYNDSTLILGTENAGIYLFNKWSGSFSKIQFHNEQPFTTAAAVRKDKDNNIWFTGNHNIGFYIPQQKQFAAYRPAKGLMRDVFRGEHFMISRKGNWFAWSFSEVLMFNPDTLRISHARGSVSITGFKVLTDLLPIDSLLQDNLPVKLSYRQNFITIEFSDLRYSTTVQTNYYYRLDGVDNDWVHGGPAGYANYTDLDAGKYIFHVKASIAGHLTGEVSIQIIITPPFWKVWWFRLLCTTMLVLAILGGILWYIGGVKKESRMKQQLAQTEMMALRAQMNPHFIFNCINSIDALIQCDDKYLATVSLNKFAKLIRNILESSQHPNTTLSQDLETLRLYIDLEQLRTEHAFVAEINVEDQLLEENYKVPSLIIQPYVENSILHGLRNRRDGGGKLCITVKQEGEYLCYTIEDNGVGRDAARRRNRTHQPYGMELSWNRVELFNGDDKIPVIITDLQENGIPTGTRVVVTVKYS